MPRRIFIGDIHGHFDGLMRLWDAIAPNDSDRIYCVGDLIDRGPRSAEVVEFVRQHVHGCVRGNHEQLMLDAFVNGGVNMATLQGWLYSGGQATLSSYGADSDTLIDHRAWIASLPLYIDLGDVWLVHAGLNPKLSVEQQSSYELCWIRETFHGSEEPYFPDKTIITGHTITFTFPGIQPGQIVQGRGWLDIDTGVYHPRSGWLTALDWDNRQVYQVNVFDYSQRRRPLEAATTSINPSNIKHRYRERVSKPSGV